MLMSDAIKHYKSKTRIARALGIGKAAVSKWGEVVPRGWAAELHVLTKGRLKFDQWEYRDDASRCDAEAA